MGRNRKIADNIISKNLDRILGGNLQKNLEIIENRLGLAKPTVRNWINGKRRPQLVNLEKIADLFNFDVYSLFKEDNFYLPEQKEIMDMIPSITDKEVLSALKAMAKIGMVKRHKNKDEAPQ